MRRFPNFDAPARRPERKIARHGGKRFLRRSKDADRVRNRMGSFADNDGMRSTGG